MAAAAQARRRNPQLEIAALELGRWTSYSACGIPFLIGGSLDSANDLVARSPEEFRAMRIDVRTEPRVIGFDPPPRPGQTPRRPEVPGLDLPHVHGVQNLTDANRLLDDARALRPRQVVVLGSGYVGLELAEAFIIRGASVTVIEPGPE